MKRVVLFTLAVSVVVSCAVRAQEPPQLPPPGAQDPPAIPVQTPPLPAQTPQTPPPTAAPEATVPATAAPLDAETVRRRRREIKNMEGVLASAVRSAAQEIATEMETPETGKFLLSGSLGARGFILDGYGVFFHVEIPGVRPSLISPMVLESLQQRLAQQRQAQPEVASTGNATVNVPNADAQYVNRVKDALMRAMIQYSKPLELRLDEWLTVAAGDGDEPFMPAVLSEQALMVMRIRGRDIAEFMAGRLTLDDVLKKVEVRKF